MKIEEGDIPNDHYVNIYAEWKRKGIKKWLILTSSISGVKSGDIRGSAGVMWGGVGVGSEESALDSKRAPNTIIHQTSLTNTTYNLKVIVIIKELCGVQ